MIELIVRSSNPMLLQGLDAWLQLGLISDEAVRRIGREYLSCRLFVPVPAEIAIPEPELEPVPAQPEPELQPVPARSPGIVVQVLQSLMAEISVVWLLFLGVFLVVVSSGVLAATQWRNFSSVGQYSILLGYTLAFWVASLLAGRQPNLRLTARMLQVVTLLIIPVNFWMMDGFQLLSSGLGRIVAAIAALLLTAVTVLLLQSGTGTSILTIVVAIALNWLHWGWNWSGFPLLATYIGSIGTTLVLVYENWGLGVGDSGLGGEDSQPGTETATPSSPLPLSAITIAFAILLLIARATFVAQVPVNQLGLAVGVSGWLLVWLSRWDSARIVWTRVGTGLLLLAWMVTVTATPPAQAIAISGLGLWLLADGLRRSGQESYLIAGFLVGLQAVWLCWRALPLPWQQSLVNTGIQLAGTDAMPVALLGLWFFPYLLLTVWLSMRLRRWQNVALAGTTEILALGLGLILTIVSFGNPLVRSLNLTLSSLTLAAVIAQRRRPGWFLVYLTHASGLAAIAAILYTALPGLSLNWWATLLLNIMLAEWVFTALFPSSPSPPSPPPPPSPWYQSAWHFGLVLAAISYVLLAQQPRPVAWNSLWLITPLALTSLGYRRSFFATQDASWLSLVALLAIQPLMLTSTTERLIGFGVAAGLMLFNTHQLRKLIAAVLTVGFCLGFTGLVVWEVLRQDITLPLLLNLLAIAILLLWGLRHWLSYRHTVLARLYLHASDGWAIALTGLTLLSLTLLTILVYLNWDTPQWQYTLAAGLLLLATAYRTGQRSGNSGFYAIAWSLELLTLNLIAQQGRSLDAVAIANLALALVSQLAGDWWVRKEGWERRAEEWGMRDEEGEESEARSQDSLSSRSLLSVLRPPFSTPPLPLSPSSPLPLPRSPSPALPFPPSSLHLIPLLYALLGVVIAHRSFTASTGLYTLAAAAVGIGVGRRHTLLQPLTYLAIVGASLAAYELLVYQLLQARGGSPGDGILLLAVLATAIAIAYRFLVPWLIPYLHLSSESIRWIAHLHWGAGSFLLLSAIANALSSTGEWLWIGLALILSGYALTMANRYWGGRQRAEDRGQSPQSLWTYPGILQFILACAKLLSLLLPESVLLEWTGAIAAVFAVTFYFLPWHRWGWERDPWQWSMAALPGVVVALTAIGITIQSLLIVAAFYVWLAKAERQIRLSYLGLLLANWAMLRLLDIYGRGEPLWYALLLGASLLYIAQVDPDLRSPTEREKRHWLRSLATGLICLTALYQSEIGISNFFPLLLGLLTSGLIFCFILAGLLLQTRAYLYVGTATFILQLLRLLWRFIADYSLLLWAIGIVLGLLLIWVAATFEARRSQVNALLQYWVVELQGWE